MIHVMINMRERMTRMNRKQWGGEAIDMSIVRRAEDIIGCIVIGGLFILTMAL
jgi:hypothetical protein